MNINRLCRENIVMPNEKFPVWSFFYSAQAPGELFATHWHENIEMVTIKKGFLDITCEGKLLRIAEGDTFFANPNEYHSCLNTSDNLELYCAIFNLNSLHSSIIDSCDEKFILPILKNQIFFPNHLVKDKQIYAFVEAITNEINVKAVGYELRVKALLLNIISYIFNSYPEKIEHEKMLTIKTVNHKRVQEVIAYIEANYQNNISIDDIADSLFINKFYLCKIFKEFTDVSIIYYLNMHRINKAIELLISTEMSITEIAIQTGFNEINYFSRMFKSYTKLSPSQVKKNNNVQLLTPSPPAKSK